MQLLIRVARLAQTEAEQGAAGRRGSPQEMAAERDVKKRLSQLTVDLAILGIQRAQFDALAEEFDRLVAELESLEACSPSARRSPGRLSWSKRRSGQWCSFVSGTWPWPASSSASGFTRRQWKRAVVDITQACARRARHLDVAHRRRGDGCAVPVRAMPQGDAVSGTTRVNQLCAANRTKQLHPAGAMLMCGALKVLRVADVHARRGVGDLHALAALSAAVTALEPRQLCRTRRR